MAQNNKAKSNQKNNSKNYKKKDNKELHLALGIIGIAVVVLAAVCILLGVFGSGKMGKIEDLKATAYVTGEQLTLPFSFSRGEQTEQSTTFMTAESLQDLSKQISDKMGGEGVTANLVGDKYLVLQKEQDGVQSCYMIYKQEQNRYLYSGMHVQFAYRAGKNDQESIGQMVFPYHLLNDNRVTGTDMVFEANTSYRTTADMGDFQQFYQSMGLYDIQEDKNAFVITGYNSSIDSSKYPAFEGPLQFRFGEERGYKFVNVDRYTEE